MLTQAVLWVLPGSGEYEQGPHPERDLPDVYQWSKARNVGGSDQAQGSLYQDVTGCSGRVALIHTHSHHDRGSQ